MNFDNFFHHTNLQDRLVLLSPYSQYAYEPLSDQNDIIPCVSFSIVLSEETFNLVTLWFRWYVFKFCTQIKMTLPKSIGFAIKYLKCKNIDKLIYINFSHNIRTTELSLISHLK